MMRTVAAKENQTTADSQPLGCSLVSHRYRLVMPQPHLIAAAAAKATRSDLRNAQARQISPVAAQNQIHRVMGRTTSGLAMCADCGRPRGEAPRRRRRR